MSSTTPKPEHPRRRHIVQKDEPTAKEREYLEVMYYLSARKEPIIAARLARWMSVQPPTVTHILQQLESKGLIVRDPKGEIALTSNGHEIAEAMVTRHRVLERFLVDVMGIQWHQIHEEAVRLEHALTPVMEERIVELTRHAETCPHGNPIPGKAKGYSGKTRLDQAPEGQDFILRRIAEEAEEDSGLMRYMQSNGMVPGVRFTITESSSTYGVGLKHGDATITLSAEIAAVLWGDVVA